MCNRVFLARRRSPPTECLLQSDIQTLNTSLKCELRRNALLAITARRAGRCESQARRDFAPIAGGRLISTQSRACCTKRGLKCILGRGTKAFRRRCCTAFSGEPRS